MKQKKGGGSYCTETCWWLMQLNMPELLFCQDRAWVAWETKANSAKANLPAGCPRI